MEIVETLPVPTVGRVEAMVKDRSDGATLQEIGDKWGVTRERVRQLLDQAGYDRSTFVSRPDRELQSEAEKISGWLQEFGPVTRAELFLRFDMDDTRWHRLTIDNKVPTNLVLASSPSVTYGYTRDDAVEAVRVIWARASAAEPGLHSLTRDTYRQYMPTEGKYPSPELIVSRWPWSQVCADAGVPAKPAKRKYRTKWSDADILDWIRRFIGEQTAAGEGVTFQAYNDWAQRTSGAPSGPTVRNQMRKAGTGSWPTIVVMARDGELP